MSSETSGVALQAKPEKLSEKQKPQVSCIKPDYVSIEKDVYEKLENKNRSLQSQVNSYDNVQFEIQHLQDKLKKGEEKSMRFQTALFATESRLADILQAQLEKPSQPTEKTSKVKQTSQTSENAEAPRTSSRPPVELENKLGHKQCFARTVPLMEDRNTSISEDSGFSSYSSDKSKCSNLKITALETHEEQMVK